MDAVYIGFDSAWTAHTAGAAAAVLEDSHGLLSLSPPFPLAFADAASRLTALHPEARLRVIGIDQSTVVPNATGCRPVERAVSSVVCTRKGAIQPSFRERAEMFGDGAPIWAFLNEIAYRQQPYLLRPMEGRYVLEVYPCLNLLGFIPDFRERKRCAKYNPARTKTFSLADWQQVCLFVRDYGVAQRIAGLPEWAEQFASCAQPRKADQDALDAVLCTLIALEWAKGGVIAPHGMVLGDLQQGYLFTVADDALAEEAERACTRYLVPCMRLW